MPTGILTDVSSVVLGGILGCLLGSRLSDRWKMLLNNMLGMSALVMGIVLILRVHTLSAAVLSMIVGALLGKIVPVLGIPQLCVFMLLFFFSGLVAPYITPDMIADFSAVGGIVTLTAGLRLSRIKTDIKVLNLLPSLPLAFVISALWTALIG